MWKSAFLLRAALAALCAWLPSRELLERVASAESSPTSEGLLATSGSAADLRDREDPVWWWNVQGLKREKANSIDSAAFPA